MERSYQESQRKALKKNAEKQQEASHLKKQDFDLVSLQRLVGNQAVQRLIADGQLSIQRQPSTFIQTKLSVGAADDAYEREADAVAQQVVNMPDTAVQREDAPEEEELMMKRADIQREDTPEEEELMMKRADIQREDTPEEEELMMKRADIQREDAPEEEELMMKRADIQREDTPEEEELMMKRADIQRADGMEGAFEIGGDLESQIQSKKGSGETLSGESQNFFESRFGYDFSGVKVHTDAQSDNLNRSLSARAFTAGSDIFFRQGEYNPGTKGGQELMAHELTHVVQQGGAGVKTKADDQER